VNKFLRLLIWWVVGSIMAAGILLLELLPWHPQSALGWAVLLGGALPVMFAFEFLGDRVIYRNPVGARLDAMGPGARASTLRIIYLLACFIFAILVCWVAVAALSRSRLFGAL
jgi:hypothetical protein